MFLWHAVWTLQLTSNQPHIFPPCQPDKWNWHIKVQPDSHAEGTDPIVLEKCGLLALLSHLALPSWQRHAAKKRPKKTAACVFPNVARWHGGHVSTLFSASSLSELPLTNQSAFIAVPQVSFRPLKPWCLAGWAGRSLRRRTHTLLPQAVYNRDSTLARAMLSFYKDMFCELFLQDHVKSNPMESYVILIFSNCWILFFTITRV